MKRAGKKEKREKTVDQGTGTTGAGYQDSRKAGTKNDLNIEQGMSNVEV